jgi:transposase
MRCGCARSRWTCAPAPSGCWPPSCRRWARRIKLLVHDGFGVWCAARRLNAGRFVWLPATSDRPTALEITRAQFEALVLGLPWQRLPEMSVITRV